jgi:hypothetical protein
MVSVTSRGARAPAEKLEVRLPQIGDRAALAIPDDGVDHHRCRAALELGLLHRFVGRNNGGCGDEDCQQGRTGGGHLRHRQTSK